MRTSLNNLQETEQYLNGQLTPEDAVLYQARLILDTTLQEEMHWQQKTYAVVRAYGRMQLRNQLEEMHKHFMTAPRHKRFRDKILNFFSH